MKLYMAVTPDKYEHPIFIEETIKELSLKTGVSWDCIWSSIVQDLSGKNRGMKFVKVEV